MANSIMIRSALLFGAAFLTNSAVSAPLDHTFLRQYAETRGYMLGRPAAIKPAPDGKTVLFLRSEATQPKRALYEFDGATGMTRKLLASEDLLKGSEETLTPEEKARRERMRLTAAGFADFHFNEAGNQLLIPLSGRLFVYDRRSAASQELKTPAGTIIDPKWSPDGTKISYVRGHDVYVFDLAARQETAVTRGGTLVKTHGLAEFVAQEEMARFSGYWWSPDSKYIAFEEADHTGVEQWFVADPIKPDQAPLPQYYPRPGKKNVAVRLGIAPVTGGEPVWVDWDRKAFEYLAAVRWDIRGPLTIQVQDRRQQTLQLLVVDPKNGKTKKLLDERDRAWVNLSQEVPKWLPDGNQFLWISEYPDGPAVELRRIDGSLDRVVVAPQAGLRSLVHLSFPHEEIVYVASSDPTQAHVIRQFHQQILQRRPDSEMSVRLGQGNGMESVVFSQNKDVYVLTRTGPDSMPRSFVHTRDKRIGELPSVALDPPVLPTSKFEKIGDGKGFYANVLRPSNFDPKKVYPVIVDVYGGPHHIHVLQATRNWLLSQWLADQGFIVVSVDNRGTPGRGRDWERSIYGKFGEIPLADQVEGLKALGRKYPEMDLNRVGVSGWSFGGYMAALAVLKRPDVFHAAVAGAPVTDWEDYDTHYTERYMGLLPESKKEYDGSSLIPLAGELKRPLLLVHGTADDNVYFRHTLKLSDALFRAGRDFDVLPLPGLTHMVPDPVVTQRLWTRIAGHFHKHLGVPK